MTNNLIQNDRLKDINNLTFNQFSTEDFVEDKYGEFQSD
jgi:hypothetical protein